MKEGSQNQMAGKNIKFDLSLVENGLCQNLPLSVQKIIPFIITA
jgi:hypothetical protein